MLVHSEVGCLATDRRVFMKGRLRTSWKSAVPRWTSIPRVTAVCRCLRRPLLSSFGRQISTVSDVLGSYQKIPSVSRVAQLMDSPMAAARDE